MATNKQMKRSGIASPRGRNICLNCFYDWGDHIGRDCPTNYGETYPGPYFHMVNETCNPDSIENMDY